MLPQIVRTLINWLPAKFTQHVSVGMMAGVNNCRGLPDRAWGDFFIPQRLTPESSDLLSQSMIQAKESTGSLEIEDVLAAIPTDEAARRLVIIGRPGSGKTTLLTYLQRIYAENRHKQIHSGMPHLIPMRLCVPDIRSMILGDRSVSLSEAIAPMQSPEQRQRLENRFNRGDYLVTIDGLDEVDGTNDGNHSLGDRQRIVHWIDRQMQQYANTPFIVTSRENTYHLTPLQQVQIVLELQPFNDRQIQQFLQQWYQLKPDGQSRRIEPSPHSDRDRSVKLLAEIKSVRSIADMATNPFLLKAIAQVYDRQGNIPTRRVELYGVLCDRLLADRSPIASPPNRLADQKSVLQTLALTLKEQKSSQFTEGTFNQVLRQSARRFHLKDFGSLLIEIQPGVYEFAHHSFLDYLAAVEIEQSDRLALLIDNLQNYWWDETIKFYIEITKDPEVIYAALSEATTLNLAYDWLQTFATNMPLALWNAFSQKLTVCLESSNPIMFQSAAKVRLKHRCQTLLNHEELVAIDPEYITNAEYQLFVDDKRKVGQSRQPDCWFNKRFAIGSAQEAIAGVRGSDAKEFCEWLTQQYAGYGIRFRLPTLAEVEHHPATDDRLGAWCYGQKDKQIAGLSQQLWQQWQTLARIGFEQDLEQLHRSQKTLKLDLTRTLTRRIAVTLARSQKKQILEKLSQLFQQGSSHEMVKNLQHLHDLVFCLGNVDNFHHIRNFALRVSKIRQLFALRKIGRTTQIELASLRRDFLLIYICFQGLKTYYKESEGDRGTRANRHQGKIRDRGIPRNTHLLSDSPNKIRYYEHKQNEALNLYAFLLLIDAQHFQNFPPFEGIRIVKEQID